MVKGGCVYFMANYNNKVLYVGVTSELSVRVYQHQINYFPNSFTSKYRCYKLVCFEPFASIEEAIQREKEIKNWKREWKNELINNVNPQWKDLTNEIEGF